MIQDFTTVSLDDAYLEDLKEELIEGQQVAVDENGF